MGRSAKGRGKTVYLTLDALKALNLSENATSDEINQKILSLSSQVISNFNIVASELLESSKRIEAMIQNSQKLA